MTNRVTAVLALLVGQLLSGPTAVASPIGKLFQVIVNVQEMERQVGFYRDGLGFEVVESSPAGELSQATFVRMETGEALLALHAGRESVEGSAPVRLSFLCDDIVAGRKRLLGQGVPLGPIRSPAPGVLVVDTRDPEGNPLHLESRVDSQGADADTAASARRALEGWLAAYDAGEWERVIEFYSAEPSFHWIEQGRGAYDSKAAIRAGIEGLYPNVESFALEVDALEVDSLAAGLARATVGYRQEIVFPGGQTLSLVGTMTTLLGLTGDGWRLLTGHSAAQATAEPAEAGGEQP